MNATAELQRRAAEAEERAAQLKKMVEVAEQLGEDGLRELVAFFSAAETNGNGVNRNDNGHARKPRASGVPRGRTAIRRIVEERPGIWTLAELCQAMERNEWLVSKKAVEAAVERLCNIDREGRRIGKGRYVFPADHGEEASDEQAVSGAMIPAL